MKSLRIFTLVILLSVSFGSLNAQNYVIDIHVWGTQTKLVVKAGQSSQEAMLENAKNRKPDLDLYYKSANGYENVKGFAGQTLKTIQFSGSTFTLYEPVKGADGKKVYQPRGSARMPPSGGKVVMFCIPKTKSDSSKEVFLYPLNASPSKIPIGSCLFVNFSNHDIAVDYQSKQFKLDKKGGMDTLRLAKAEGFPSLKAAKYKDGKWSLAVTKRFRSDPNKRYVAIFHTPKKDYYKLLVIDDF